MIANFEGQIQEDQRFLNEGNEHVQSIVEQLADASDSLVEAESFLADDPTYLKDLTAQCEDRARTTTSARPSAQASSRPSPRRWRSSGGPCRASPKT